MGRPLLALATLFAVALCSDEYETYCHGLTCPTYQLINQHEGFEERSYTATQWISTNIESDSSVEVLAANGRLKSFCSNNGEADGALGFEDGSALSKHLLNKHRHLVASENKDSGEIISETWPVLISVSENRYFLQWFVPPGTAVPANFPSSVTLVSRPAATVYVRVFGGSPSLKNGNDNNALLRGDLDRASVTYDHSEYVGAGYDSFFSVTHHNEVWIRAA